MAALIDTSLIRYGYAVSARYGIHLGGVVSARALYLAPVLLAFATLVLLPVTSRAAGLLLPAGAIIMIAGVSDSRRGRLWPGVSSIALQVVLVLFIGAGWVCLGFLGLTGNL